MHCLIVVDIQRDFLPGGALSAPDGDRVLLPLANLARQADLVIASRDWHPNNHFSFSDDPLYQDGSWPPHCVQKTRGAQLHPSIRKYADYVISKGMNRNEEAYSAFQGKTLRPVRTLEEILRASPIEIVVVGGLVLDYCVRYTALDASALGFKTVVPLDTSVGLTVDGTQAALQSFVRAGIEVVDHYEIH